MYINERIFSQAFWFSNIETPLQKSFVSIGTTHHHYFKEKKTKISDLLFPARVNENAELGSLEPSENEIITFNLCF